MEELKIHLREMFSNLSEEIITISANHPSNEQDLGRCIDDLLELRTYTVYLQNTTVSGEIDHQDNNSNHSNSCVGGEGGLLSVQDQRVSDKVIVSDTKTVTAVDLGQRSQMTSQSESKKDTSNKSVLDKQIILVESSQESNNSKDSATDVDDDDVLNLEGDDEVDDDDDHDDDDIIEDDIDEDNSVNNNSEAPNKMQQGKLTTNKSNAGGIGTKPLPPATSVNIEESHLKTPADDSISVRSADLAQEQKGCGYNSKRRSPVCLIDSDESSNSSSLPFVDLRPSEAAAKGDKSALSTSYQGLVNSSLVETDNSNEDNSSSSLSMSSSSSSNLSSAHSDLLIGPSHHVTPAPSHVVTVNVDDQSDANSVKPCQTVSKDAAHIPQTISDSTNAVCTFICDNKKQQSVGTESTSEPVNRDRKETKKRDCESIPLPGNSFVTVVTSHDQPGLSSPVTSSWNMWRNSPSVISSSSNISSKEEEVVVIASSEVPKIAINHHNVLNTTPVISPSKFSCQKGPRDIEASSLGHSPRQGSSSMGSFSVNGTKLQDIVLPSKLCYLSSPAAPKDSNRKVDTMTASATPTISIPSPGGGSNFKLKSLLEKPPKCVLSPAKFTFTEQPATRSLGTNVDNGQSNVLMPQDVGLKQKITPENLDQANALMPQGVHVATHSSDGPSKPSVSLELPHRPVSIATTAPTPENLAFDHMLPGDNAGRKSADTNPVRGPPNVIQVNRPGRGPLIQQTPGSLAPVVSPVSIDLTNHDLMSRAHWGRPSNNIGPHQAMAVMEHNTALLREAQNTKYKLMKTGALRTLKQIQQQLGADILNEDMFTDEPLNDILARKALVQNIVPQLVLIFPEIDPTFVEGLVLVYSASMTQDGTLNYLISLLLDLQGLYPRVANNPTQTADLVRGRTEDNNDKGPKEVTVIAAPTVEQFKINAMPAEVKVNTAEVKIINTGADVKVIDAGADVKVNAGAEVKVNNAGAEVKANNAGAEVKVNNTGAEIKVNTAGAEDKANVPGPKVKVKLASAKPAATFTITQPMPPEETEEVDYYNPSVYSDPRTYQQHKHCVNACLYLLGDEFPLIPMKNIREVLRIHHNHFAPTHKCLSDIMKQLQEELKAENKEVSPSNLAGKVLTYQCTIPQSNHTRTMLVTFLKGKRSHMITSIPPEVAKEVEFVKRRQTKALEVEDELFAQKLNELEYAENGQLIECGCCYGEMPFENMVQCQEGHLFCGECLKSYASEAVFGQGKADLMCMSDDCKATFPASEIMRTLPYSIFSKYESRVQEENLNMADLKNLIKCPFCQTAAILDDIYPVFTCPNNKCSKRSCRQCQADWSEHIGKKCEELEKKDETSLRLQYEEKMTEAKIRTCAQCKARFTKLDGCNKMTCRCGAKMCYICRKPKIDYNHFCQHVRNPGKGCDKCKDCFLWSTGEEDDERAIQEIQEQAREARKAKGYEEDKLIGAPPSKRRKD